MILFSRGSVFIPWLDRGTAHRCLSVMSLVLGVVTRVGLNSFSLLQAGTFLSRLCCLEWESREVALSCFLQCVMSSCSTEEL